MSLANESRPGKKPGMLTCYGKNSVCYSLTYNIDKENIPFPQWNVKGEMDFPGTREECREKLCNLALLYRYKKI